MFPAYNFDAMPDLFCGPFGFELLSSPQLPEAGSLNARYPLPLFKSGTPDLNLRLSLPIRGFTPFRIVALDRISVPEVYLNVQPDRPSLPASISVLSNSANGSLFQARYRPSASTIVLEPSPCFTLQAPVNKTYPKSNKPYSRLLDNSMLNHSSKKRDKSPLTMPALSTLICLQLYHKAFTNSKPLARIEL